MINGAVIGLVVDNVDPDGLHRVKVEYPVDGDGGVQSSWCRLMSPMGGKLRGLTMLPDIDTEVVLMFAYRSMSPYVLGAVYNGGDDRPEPYHNDDSKNDKRVFWSRNDHMVIFDDTEGEEKVEVAAKAPTRLDVRSGPLWVSASSAEKTVEEYSDKDIIWEAVETISFKCKDFELEADAKVEMEAGDTAIYKSGSETTIQASGNQKFIADRVDINPPSSVPDPSAALKLPKHKHPPTKADEGA